ncbi:molybdate ABC transporter substrate-binding protein [Aneurinibacillus tyrosinisolvens]|uniref:molybdate ABC transporter substrate-binding protein n=1 Tax=Aneurinibacillus tyrosinisolvens TaxID=1443435 RepID=UPI00128BC678|nr:molybdate ABC transporter substrate-binding protein [Aneurinibacillus tyrosinisolvens]
MDVSTRSYVRAELKELLHKLAIPTIIVTHDYEDARVLADRVAVMDRGLIIQSGTPKEIAQYPANDFVAEFTGTNLTPIPGDRQEGTFAVAFDPWKVEVGYEPRAVQYEWQGKIRDMAWMGGFVRIQLDTLVHFYADVPVETVEKEGFKVGDHVYARIASEDVRLVTVSAPFQRIQADQALEIGTSKASSKTSGKGWKWVISAVMFLGIAAIAVGGLTSKPTHSVARVSMFALVAANATDPFSDLTKEFETSHPGVNLESTFAGTQVLRTQLEQGAKADLFLSADLKHIKAVEKEGLIEKFKEVSKNHEVIAIPKSNSAGIHSLEDLGQKPVKLVIGIDSVPIGRYTRQIFEKANVTYGSDFSKQVMSHVVSLESSTKAVLQKVTLGEAEAGVVYRTDVTPEFEKRVDIIEIPKELNVMSTNYIAVVKKSPNPELSRQFLELILSDKGQGAFLKYGYDPLK